MRIPSLMAVTASGVLVFTMLGIVAVTGHLASSKAEQVDAAAAAKPSQTSCAECGVVVAVKQFEVKGKGTGLGAVAGGVAGAVVGHEITDGKDLGTLVGAAGGAIAGHEIERHARTTKRYRIEVRMSDGSLRSVASSTQPTWKSGDRVRLQNGKLTAQS